MKYGLLIARTYNIGDDIQALAALQFLPKVDFFVDRDNPKVDSEDFVKIIFNGWFTYNPNTFHPSPNVIPLFLSFHVAPHVAEILLRRKDIVKYLKDHQPIGGRDLFTTTLLRSKGVDSYFSGCLTLTLDYKYSFIRRSAYCRYVLAIDVDDTTINLVKGGINRMGLEIFTATQMLFKPIRWYWGALPKGTRSFFERLLGKHNIDRLLYLIDLPRADRFQPGERLMLALHRVAQIANACLVLTSKLHVALTATAFNIPTIFINNNPKDPRLSGLIEFLNHYTPKQFRRAVINSRFEPDSIKNPNREYLKALKRIVIKSVETFLRE